MIGAASNARTGANLDRVNPGSVVLSDEMMFRCRGWTNAANLVIKGIDGPSPPGP